MASRRASVLSTGTLAQSVAPISKDGLGMGMAGFFLIAQMAGAGFLALPRAFANTGWISVVMMPLFCFSVAFVGIRLGRSWVILEERWPETYKGTLRQPYMDIAERALGPLGRKFTLWCVVLNLYGGTTVHMILISQMLSSLIPPESGVCLTKCHMLLIVAACLIPMTWLGSPKDFWQASILAVISTVLAIVVIIIQVLIDRDTFDTPTYPFPTVMSFARGFGSILFSFGGASVFPTIQNDMADRSKFWKSVILGFAGIFTLYFPVAMVGYVVIGDAVNSNILLSVDTKNVVVIIAICMEVLNLVCTFIISSNPTYQSIEEVLNVPEEFGPWRCLVRSSLVLVQMVIGLAVPNFDKILNLIGGSLITLCTFVLPPVMYMRLVNDRSNKAWPVRDMPLWEKVFLIEVIVVGVIGGVLATVTAIIDVVSPSGAQDASCFTNFANCS